MAIVHEKITSPNIRTIQVKTTSISSHLLEWLLSKWQEINAGKAVDYLYTLLVGVWTGAATMENNIEVPQKIKNIITIRSRNPTSEMWKTKCSLMDYFSSDLPLTDFYCLKIQFKKKFYMLSDRHCIKCYWAKRAIVLVSGSSESL